MVLDTLGPGAELEFLEGKKYGEWFAVGVGRIEDDKGEAEAVTELGGQVVLSLRGAEEEAGEAGVLDRFLGRLHFDQGDSV